MKNYKVSIIIPYYKKKLFIKETIKSVLKQSYKNFEIIVVDDENSDESNDLLKEILKLDKKIRLITNEINIGAGLSRNKALGIAEGDFIAFCDSDDLWKSTKLQIQVNYMVENDIEFSFTSYEIINEVGKILNYRFAKNLLNFADLLNSCDIGLSTVLIKKNLFNDIDLRFAKLKTKEDYVLWLKIAKKGINIFGIDKVLTSWRKTRNSLSSSTFQKLIDGFRVYKFYMKFNSFKSLVCLLKLSFNYLNKKV
jgi:teichuronic acid biosynthesis glycosyltransferase TuaG